MRDEVRGKVVSLFLLPFSFCLMASVSLTAQESPQPSFRAGTTLVEFTFVALDSKGNPVADLKKEEVMLAERGRPRDVAFFRFDGNAPAVSVAAPALAPGYVTNRPT